MDIMDISDEELKRIIRQAKELSLDSTTSLIEFGEYIHKELEMLILSKNAIDITPTNEEYIN